MKLLTSNSMDLVFTDLNSKNKKVDISRFTNNPLCIIVGPEGDFSEQERKEILNFKGVQDIKINDNISGAGRAAVHVVDEVQFEHVPEPSLFQEYHQRR